MCPEYGIYHTRYPQDDRQFQSTEKAQFISMNDIKVSYLLLTGRVGTAIDQIMLFRDLFETLIKIVFT